MKIGNRQFVWFSIICTSFFFFGQWMTDVSASALIVSAQLRHEFVMQTMLWQLKPEFTYHVGLTLSAMAFLGLVVLFVESLFKGER